MAEKIKVIIEADVDQLKKDVNKAFKNVTAQEKKMLDSFKQTNSKATEETKKLNKELDQTEKELKDINTQSEKNQSTFSKLRGVANQVGAAMLAAFAVDKLVDFGKEVFRTTQEVNKLSLTIAKMGKLSGSQLDIATANVMALSKTFGITNEQIVEAAASFSSQTGTSFVGSLKALESQFILSGGRAENVLDIVREYPLFFKKAGISIDDMNKIIGTAAQQNDFLADKVADSVKEITLSLSELTKPAKDALELAFGKPFAAKIEKDIKDGTKPIIEVFLEIGKKAKTAGLNTQQLATLTADIGKGATEDIGGIIKIYDILNESINNTNKETSQLQKNQEALLNSQKAFNAEVVEFSKNFAGFGKEMQLFSDQVLTGLLFKFNNFVKLFQSVKPTSIEQTVNIGLLQRQYDELGETIEKTAKKLAISDEEGKRIINKGIDKDIETRARLMKRINELNGVTEESTEKTVANTTAKTANAKATKKQSEETYKLIDAGEIGVKKLVEFESDLIDRTEKKRETTKKTVEEIKAATMELVSMEGLLIQHADQPTIFDTLIEDSQKLLGIIEQSNPKLAGMIKLIAGIAQIGLKTFGGDATQNVKIDEMLGGISGFKDGGLVGGNEQLIRINEMGEEFVIKADRVKQLGVDALNKLNKGHNFDDLAKTSFNGSYKGNDINTNQNIESSLGASLLALNEVNKSIKENKINIDWSFMEGHLVRQEQRLNSIEKTYTLRGDKKFINRSK